VHVALNFNLCTRPPFNFKIEEILKIQPELRVGFEVACQAHGSIGGNSTARMYDFADTGGRDVKI
jgi:hypothetical protein